MRVIISHEGGDFLNERIKQIRKDKKLSQLQFGKSLNISQNHISAIEHGTRAVTDRLISDICRIYNVNKDWLMTGEGEMYDDPLAPFVIDDPEIKDFVKSYLKMDPFMQEKIKEMIEHMINKEK